ncbi:hypothetical protein L915_12476 [Phytophthora nicotianae]|uniref:Uncharacterized protein n=1 Tax=Phytophthora nicotianae TaxID=4792 RepID=W2GIP4_PHYNI|nr:hypothetical protein L915_12476 [Phytophthora nicotianae]
MNKDTSLLNRSRTDGLRYYDSVTVRATLRWVRLAVERSEEI